MNWMIPPKTQLNYVTTTISVPKEKFHYYANYAAHLASLLDEGISDSGMAGHFILPSTLIEILRVATNLITITLQDRKKNQVCSLM